MGSEMCIRDRDEVETPIVMATLRNNAGIVGAALWAAGWTQTVEDVD